MEAWVRPTALGSTWRTVVIKEQPAQLSYALYANTSNTRPSVHVHTSSDVGLRGPSALPLNTWSHLAGTWNALVMRLYVNGTEVANSPLVGTALTSNSPLRIGGTAVWPEWFAGQIDEVRVYNRALSQPQIAADRDTPIGGAALARAGARATTRSNRAAGVGKVLRRHTRDADRVSPRPRRKAHRGTHWLKNKRSVARRRG
jgi:hypothetical protein